jgi:hypothetical protein
MLQLNELTKIIIIIIIIIIHVMYVCICIYIINKQIGVEFINRVNRSRSQNFCH